MTTQRKNFDWNEVHRSLEKFQSMIEQDDFISEAETKKILHARAHLLSNDTKDQFNNEAEIEILEFTLAEERYAIETSFVREVYSLKDLTTLPCVPSFILGIVNIRGEIVSIIDTKRFFELPAKGLTNLNKAIILTSEHMTFGILADEIVGTRNISKTDIQVSIPTLTGIRDAYLHGIISNHTAILDASKILTDKNLLIYETVD